MVNRATVITLDVAHPPMSSEEAEAALDDLLKAGRSTGPMRTGSPGTTPRVIRVIHGYGSGGRGGTLRTAVRNWAYRRRDRIRMAVPGEEFSPLDPKTAGLVSDAGLSAQDIGPVDQGVTILFLP